jgi:iron complex outermembrane receptor protein
MKGSISVWGRNLTNNRKFEYLFSLLGTEVIGTFQTPRTYGVDLRVAF